MPDQPSADGAAPERRDLTGRVALVTGGASGIGLSTCLALRGRGAQVVCADLDAEAAERAAADHDLVALQLDVGDPGAWERAVTRVVSEHAALDIALMNAGVTTGVSDVTAVDDASYRRAMRVNVDGVVFGMRACGQVMRQRGGDLIATASLAGLVPTPADPVYTATKHAVVGLCRAAAGALADRGVRVNAVCPGFADTPLVEGVMRDVAAGMGVSLLDPADVADAVLAVLDSGGSGEAWYVQPGRAAAPFAFRGVPGPR